MMIHWLLSDPAGIDLLTAIAAIVVGALVWAAVQLAAIALLVLVRFVVSHGARLRGHEQVP